MNATDPGFRGTVLLVLGMHRSGTSAITRVLNLLGVPLGHDLLPPQNDNSKGFWEHVRAVDINERLLMALGRNWHDMREMPTGWLKHPAALKAQDEIVALAQSEITNGLWAVKDPRLCRLAPVWLSALARERFNVKALLVVRDPREVALSLRKRDGWTPAHTYLMWAQHLIEACEATHDIPRALSTYDELLADWRGLTRRIATGLDITWPRSEEQIGMEIDGFIDAGDRHHHVTDHAMPSILEDEPLPSLLETLYVKATMIAGGQLGWEAMDGACGLYHEAASLFSTPIADLVSELKMGPMVPMTVEESRVQFEALHEGLRGLHTDEVPMTVEESRVQFEALHEGLRGLFACLQDQVTTIKGMADIDRQAMIEAIRHERNLKQEMVKMQEELLHMSTALKTIEQSKTWRYSAWIRKSIRLLQGRF